MPRRQNNNASSWTELLLFVAILVCIYFTLALFNSSITGDSGKDWGNYFRTNWGGAVIVLFLFGMYVCSAKLFKFRIPKLPRQVLGTLQLYISFAFMLGYLKELDWTSELTLFLPGKFGAGLAHFFVLNIGTFLTLILVAGAFLLSAVLFGSRLLQLSLPDVSSFSIRKLRRPTRKLRTQTVDETNDIPEPVLATDSSPQLDFMPQSFDFPMPTLEHEQHPAPDPVPSTFGTKSGQTTLEKIDDALAILDAGTAEREARRSYTPKTPQRTRKLRRPLPEVTFPDADTEPQADTPSRKVTLPKAQEDAVFPPPPEIFGERLRFDASRITQRDTGRQGRAIINTLKNFNINASVAQVVMGPAVIQYKLDVASGVKMSKVASLDEELIADLAVTSVRIEAPILGTHYVGIEVPNPERKIVSLRSMFEAGEFINSEARLPLPLGVKTGGKVLVRGLEELMHVLIAGNEGSGRRTFVNTCIMSLCSIRRPDELRLILIDTRHVDFSEYDELPHLLAKPVNDIKTARKALDWAAAEMDRRTEEFANEKARNIEAYNRKVKKSRRIPEIVIVISELADLMYSTDEFSDIITKLARKAGSAGIYLLIAAQKPSPDVLTSLLKSLIPARTVFALSSQSEAKNAMDSSDAARLTGKGDMLFLSTSNPVPVRLQAPYINDNKIADFVEYLSTNLDAPEFTTFD